jgi:K+-transporting ATPase ATPase C chain
VGQVANLFYDLQRDQQSPHPLPLSQRERGDMFFAEVDMLKQTKQALLLLAVLTIFTGLLYPLAITGVAQAVFPRQANGSLIRRDGRPVGSALIGQNFTDPKYFWSRPSATAPNPYDASSSGGSNLGPLNPDLGKAVRERIAMLKKADPGNAAPIPVDLVTTSASGLDPHISPAAAEYQVARVAKARGLDAETVRRLVARHTEGRTLGLLGEPRVNVVELNLDLDHLGR